MVDNNQQPAQPLEKAVQMDFLQQLMYLKGLTMRTGVIHEAQALQLRNWPLLVPGVKKAETHIDTDQKFIKYICEPKFKTFRVTKSVKDQCNNICIFARKITWDDAVVVFFSGKKPIWDSRIDYVRTDQEPQPT